MSKEIEFEMSEEKVNNEVAPCPTDLGWGTYVLSKLDSTEFFNGSPTVDGLRRVVQLLLGEIIESSTDILQCPHRDNNNRVTAVHSIRIRTAYCDKIFDGSADVSSDNVDAKYSKFPVALAETRAESRALRRALNLKVVAAEELDNQPDQPTPIVNTTGGATSVKISPEQIKGIELIAGRIGKEGVDLQKFITSKGISYTNANDLSHENGVLLIEALSQLQSNVALLDPELKGYKADWRTNES